MRALLGLAPKNQVEIDPNDSDASELQRMMEEDSESEKSKDLEITFKSVFDADLGKKLIENKRQKEYQEKDETQWEKFNRTKKEKRRELKQRDKDFSKQKNDRAVLDAPEEKPQ